LDHEWRPWGIVLKLMCMMFAHMTLVGVHIASCAFALQLDSHSEWRPGVITAGFLVAVTSEPWIRRSIARWIAEPSGQGERASGLTLSRAVNSRVATTSARGTLSAMRVQMSASGEDLQGRLLAPTLVFITVVMLSP